MRIARDEGWLAEHMLITGLTNPQGEKKYFVAAFPSACGKTNLAMMQPSLPGWKVECVGDDIAWMWFDETGQLRAVNPEYGFFGVAPGTSEKTNPVAMETCAKDTIFTNTAETTDGDFWWEGLPMPKDNVKITSWLEQEDWHPEEKTRCAHPNSRFTALAKNCPIMDKDWENPAGVPISGILFGGRRPVGVPLVYEAFNWQHGVFIASAMTSEATAAAEHKAKVLMHDPFAMRPFFGYNFGKYMEHWLSFGKKPNLKLPKIFHVNWFRKEDGKFLWPGFGENSRVLDWCFRRCNQEDIADNSPIGLIPKLNSINTDGLDKVDMEKLLDIPQEYWMEEVQRLRKYYDDQVGADVPEAVLNELNALEQRIKAMN